MSMISKCALADSPISYQYGIISLSAWYPAILLISYWFPCRHVKYHIDFSCQHVIMLMITCSQHDILVRHLYYTDPAWYANRPYQGNSSEKLKRIGTTFFKFSATAWSCFWSWTGFRASTLNHSAESRQDWKLLLVVEVFAV